MKKVIYAAVMAGVSGVAFAGDMAKEYQKLIGKCDVVKEARWVDCGSPAEYWAVSIGENRELARFNQDIKKNKGAEKEALKAELKLPHFYPDHNEYVVAGLQSYCDSLVADMSLDKLGINFTFNIISSAQPNVFSAPTEDGFAICITEGLCRNPYMTDDIMKGYVAHEFAHGALRHELRQLYSEAKKKRSDRVLGAVVFGVTAAAVGTLDYVLDDNTPVVYTIPLFDDSPSEPANKENVEKASNRVLNDLNSNLKNNTLLYSFNFTPEQIYEADLMAYRFLQNIGVADTYFDGLKILGARYDSQFATVPKHPSIAQRLNFLKYVEENPGYTRNDD